MKQYSTTFYSSRRHRSSQLYGMPAQWHCIFDCHQIKSKPYDFRRASNDLKSQNCIASNAKMKKIKSSDCRLSANLTFTSEYYVRFPIEKQWPCSFMTTELCSRSTFSNAHQSVWKFINRDQRGFVKNLLVLDLSFFKFFSGKWCAIADYVVKTH